MIRLILFTLIFSSSSFAQSENMDRRMYMREYQEERRLDKEKKKKARAKKRQYKQRPGGKYQPKKKNQKID